jgi:hypothetical protein
MTFISCGRSNELPITTGPENSYVIYVDGTPIEAYELPRIFDNGEDWGDPSAQIPYGTLKDLQQGIEAAQGAILRVKVNRLYQEDYYAQAKAYTTYCDVELTVESVFDNFSKEQIAIGDTLTTIQYDAIVKIDGEEFLYTYEGSRHMRPGFSYIIFATITDNGQLRIYQYDTLLQVGVFELAPKEVRDSFRIYRRGDGRAAKEVYAEYAPSILDTE